MQRREQADRMRTCYSYTGPRWSVTGDIDDTVGDRGGQKGGTVLGTIYQEGFWTH